MWKKHYQRAKEADAASSLARWSYKAFDYLFPTATVAVVGWVAWFWNSYGALGAIFVGLMAALLASLAVFLAGLGSRAWRSGAAKATAPSSEIAAGRKILKDKFVYGGTAPSIGRNLVLPSFHATFAANGENVRIFVDEIYFLPLPGSPIHWTTKNHLLLREIRRVSRDETISIPLLSQFDRDGQTLWRWGEDGAAEAQYLFITNATYKGRVRVVSADGQQEYCYFIVIGMESDGGRLLPQVIGEHMFNFAAQWEAEDA